MMKPKTNDSNELPETYMPSDYDVICGWARQNYHHAGNRRLREIIAANVPKYIAAKTKSDKGEVIMEIFEKLCRESPTGVGLVRLNQKSGRWSFIGTDKAKDKIGHALRKASQEQQKRLKEGSRKRKVLSPSETRDVPPPVPSHPPPLGHPCAHCYQPPMPHHGHHLHHPATAGHSPPCPYPPYFVAQPHLHHPMGPPTAPPAPTSLEGCRHDDAGRPPYSFHPKPPPSYWDVHDEHHYHHVHHPDSRTLLYSPMSG